MILSQDLCFISSWITKRRQEERRVTSTPNRHMWFIIQISFKFYFSWIKWWSHPKWQLRKQVLNILLFEKNHNLSKKWSFQSIQMLMSDPLQSSAKVSSGAVYSLVLLHIKLVTCVTFMFLYGDFYVLLYGDFYWLFKSQAALIKSQNEPLWKVIMKMCWLLPRITVAINLITNISRLLATETRFCGCCQNVTKEVFIPH